MEHVTTKTRICEFCGREIHYKVVENDGIDWMGHHRGTPSLRTVDYDCKCDKSSFKKMCLNCNNFHLKSCTSKKHLDKINEELKTYSEWIDLPVISSVTPKNVTNHCEFWVISETIASKLFK